MNPMTMTQDAIGLMILNWNGKQWLPPLYESIRRNEYPHFHIYLVDNASNDGSVEITLNDHPDVTVIRMPQNVGFAMAYNLAMPHAFADGCDWVIWANNDILLESGCLSELVKAVHSDSNILVAGPSFLSWSTDEPNYYMKGHCPHLIPAMKIGPSSPADVDWVEGSFLMVHRSSIEKVGPLSPHFFMFWEEAEFCRRIRYWGKRVVLVPGARVRHYGGASSEGHRNTGRDWFLARNYYIYTLTDPFKSFFRNLLATTHLLAVNLKARAKSMPGAILLELRAYATVLIQAYVWHEKWRDVRRGTHPDLLDEKYRKLRPDVLRAGTRAVTPQNNNGQSPI
jgi:GT2 family glycosyltransferase